MDEKVKEIKEIRTMWDYPNADNLDWNDAKNTVDRLLSLLSKKEKENENG